MSAFRIAVLGLGEAGCQWLRALRAQRGFEIVALADHERKVVAALAEASGAKLYTDYRLLLVEQDLDGAIVALPPFIAERFLPVAAQRGIAVLKETPLARNLESAARAVRMFADVGVPLVVASRWRFEPTLATMFSRGSPIGAVHQFSATVMADPGEELGWRGDAHSAGGGVLLDAAYEVVDMIAATMGLPGDVITQFGRLSATMLDRYDTEDTATLLCRHSLGAAATVSASWRPGPPDVQVCVVGSAGRATLSKLALTIAPSSEAPCAVRRPGESESLAAILESFVQTVRTHPRGFPGQAGDQLATAAILEAAYLSGRTHAVENPLRCYELAGVPHPRGPVFTSAAAI